MNISENGKRNTKHIHLENTSVHHRVINLITTTYDLENCVQLNFTRNMRTFLFSHLRSSILADGLGNELN